MTTAIVVVEFRLGDRIIDVDGLKKKVALLFHLNETVNAGGGFFGYADDFLKSESNDGDCPHTLSSRGL